MAFTNFRQYCELQDATVSHKPNPNSGFHDVQNRPFEQVVDPLIADFVKKILTNAMSEYTVQLQPQQIEYIITKIQNDLQGLKYNANDDLGKTINNLWKQGNSAAAVNTRKDHAAETPLATQINDLFRSKR